MTKEGDVDSHECGVSMSLSQGPSAFNLAFDSSSQDQDFLNRASLGGWVACNDIRRIRQRDVILDFGSKVVVEMVSDANLPLTVA